MSLTKEDTLQVGITAAFTLAAFLWFVFTLVYLQRTREDAGDSVWFVNLFFFVA